MGNRPLGRYSFGMSIMRVKSRWTIPGAGTAYSVMHFTGPDGFEATDADAAAAVTLVRQFFGTVAALLPNPVKVQVEGDVEQIDTPTGNLIAGLNGGNPGVVDGQAAAGASWAAPAGACITWTTGQVRTVASKPRRVRGRTFIVPVSTAAYDANGNFTQQALDTLAAAAINLRNAPGGPEFVVYGRPGPNDLPAGMVAFVSGHKITDQVAILRSRRS
jgi:hypothetical protein